MIVNKINNRINPTIILSNNRESNAQLQSTKPNNTLDVFQKQLNFMGLLNTTLKPNTLDKYFRKLDSVRLANATILCKKNCITPFATIILLDKPRPLTEGIDLLTKNVGQFRKKSTNAGLYFNKPLLDSYKYIIQDVPMLQNNEIRGIIGNGSYSTAFLTAKNEILKLSFVPNFPHPKNFIKNVEVPIIEGYVIKNKKGTLYGVKELFLEDGATKGIDLLEHAQIWQTFNQKMEKFNPDYKFDIDYRKNDIFTARQIGFNKNTPYLLDHGSILNRPLVNFSDANSNIFSDTNSYINKDAYPIHFIER